MMRPSLRYRFAPSRKALNVPFRLIAINLSKSLSLVSAMVDCERMPALFTSTSMPPNCLAANSNIAATAAGSLTSALNAEARPPDSTILRTSSSAGLALRRSLRRRQSRHPQDARRSRPRYRRQRIASLRHRHLLEMPHSLNVDCVAQFRQDASGRSVMRHLTRGRWETVWGVISSAE